MKARVLSACLLVMVFPFSSIHADDDLYFFPIVGIGQSNLEFTRKNSGIADTEQNYSFYVINIAGVLSYKDFFINAATDIPLSNDSAYNVNADQNTNGVTHVQRDEYSITAGYGPFDWMSLFAGYANGHTEFTSTTDDGYGYISDQRDRGIFGGLGFSTNIAKHGSLSFDIAYANFDGSIRLRTLDPAPTLAPFRDRRLTGSTTGYSYGLQWTAKFRTDMSYFVKLKIRQYKFEAEEANTNPQPTGAVIEKNFTMLSAGLIF